MDKKHILLILEKVINRKGRKNIIILSKFKKLPKIVLKMVAL
jgi:hypothetical protein